MGEKNILKVQLTNFQQFSNLPYALKKICTLQSAIRQVVPVLN